MKKISYQLLVCFIFVTGIHSISLAKAPHPNPFSKDEVFKHYENNPDDFIKDMKKYYPTKKSIAGKSVRVLLPIGIGLAMISLSGPQAAIPITIGTATGAAEFIRYLRLKSVRHLFQGAWHHLILKQNGIPSKSERKKIKKFEKFFKKVQGDFQQKWYPELESESAKDALAIHLLRINRYSWWFAHRFNTDKDVRNLTRPSHKFKRIFTSNKTSEKGVFSKGFLKRNLNVLVSLDALELSKHLNQNQRQVLHEGTRSHF